MQKKQQSYSCTKVAELATPASLDGKLAGLKARQEGNTVGRQRSTHIKYNAYEIKEVRMVEKDGGVSCKGVGMSERIVRSLHMHKYIHVCSTCMQYLRLAKMCDAGWSINAVSSGGSRGS